MNSSLPSSISNAPYPTHSVGVGYLLWIFGFMGFHRFYYGKPISGFVYLCTLGLLGIGWIVDLFLIPGMAKEASGRYQAGRYEYNLTWLLHAFLGVFGLHRMYLGKWISGFIWLFTGGLFTIGWFYDFATLNHQIAERNREVGH